MERLLNRIAKSSLFFFVRPSAHPFGVICLVQTGKKLPECCNCPDFPVKIKVDRTGFIIHDKLKYFPEII
jgi:hypothetical protein